MDQTTNYGYCCINTTLQKSDKITTNRSMIKRTFAEKGIDYASELALANVKDLVKIINWNNRQGIKLFRISSDMFPWMSEYNLSDLPDHDFIHLTFDLYIHDSWEGNASLEGEALDEKDSWVLEIDTARNQTVGDRIYYETTFSNGLCIPSFCYTQSFPDQFPSTNDARKEVAEVTNGRCSWPDTPNGTSIYKMDLVFQHTDRNAVLSFYDKLNGSLCDESWSLDNLSVSLIKKN